MNIIKIKDSPFSLFTWYQSQKGKPNFFLSVIVFPFGHFILLLEPSAVGSPRRRHRQISSPLPPSNLLAISDFFRPALLRSKTSDFEAHEADRRKPRQKTAFHASPHTALLRWLAFHALARVGAWPTFW